MGSFFDDLGIAYQYEPEGFTLPDGTRYLPDFWLPDVRFRFWKPEDGIAGIWFEVKGSAQDADIDKLDKFAKSIKQPVILADGTFDGSGPTLTHYLYGEDPDECWWDSDLLFMKCPHCRKYRIQFCEGSYERCDACNARSEFIDWDHSSVNVARSARFEFGERP